MFFQPLEMAAPIQFLLGFRAPDPPAESKDEKGLTKSEAYPLRIR